MVDAIICKLTKLDGSTITYNDIVSIHFVQNITPIVIDPPVITPPITPTDKDIFGIKIIYPSLQNGEKWFMNMLNPAGDPRFNPQTVITKNQDGSWKCKADKVRMNVYTSSGHDSKKITTINQVELAKKGYMLAANDWRNVEITGYVKVNAFTALDNFAWYARGGKHGDIPGEGTAYKHDLFWNGTHRFAKEQWHAGGYSYTETKKVCESIANKWVGFKAVMFNTPAGGVKLESYLDYDCNNNWVKIDERLDTGKWGKEGVKCGGAPDQIISWGGSIACFRWDSTSDVDFKYFSVREILPPSA